MGPSDHWIPKSTSSHGTTMQWCSSSRNEGTGGKKKKILPLTTSRFPHVDQRIGKKAQNASSRLDILQFPNFFKRKSCFNSRMKLLVNSSPLWPITQSAPAKNQERLESPPPSHSPLYLLPPHVGTGEGEGVGKILKLKEISKFNFFILRGRMVFHFRGGDVL